MDHKPPSDSSARLGRLERELVRCIGGDFAFRLTVSEQDDDLDAVATGINVLLDEVEYTMAEAAARRDAAAVLQKQALLFETIQDGVSIIGADGRLVAWNPAASRLFSLSANAVMGGGPFPMLAADVAEALDAEVSEALRERKSWQGEVAVGCPDDVSRICEATIVPVHGPEGGIVGRVQIFRDVTDARVLEQRLQHAERLKSLGLLAGGVAHDFNNQLTGIQSAAEVLRRMMDEGSERLLSYVDTILLASHRAATLTEQLLAFARRGPLRLEPVSMNEIVREVVDLFERSVDKRIEVRLNRVNCHVAVMGDSTQLQNVLLNIAFNARDAMPRGGELHVSTQVVSLSSGTAGDPPLPVEEGPYVRISIRDTGVGMSPSVRRRIFEPFFTTKPQGRGVGMGLSAVFGVIEGHQGTIDVASVVGQGTTFTIDLPLTEHVEVSEYDARSTPATAADAHGEQILVVDDEEIIRTLVKDILEMEGYRVTSCADGQTALAFFETNGSDVDAVVLDMMMPHLHGRDVLARMQEIDPHVPVVVCSGFDDGPDLADRPTVRFIQKPYELSELLRTLQGVMSGASDA